MIYRVTYTRPDADDASGWCEFRCEKDAQVFAEWGAYVGVFTNAEIEWRAVEA